MRFLALPLLLLHAAFSSSGIVTSYSSRQQEAGVTTTTNNNNNNGNVFPAAASNSLAVHQASPECWKIALNAFQHLRHENHEESTLSSSSSSELSLALCSTMTSEHQDLLALEVTRCHMKGRSIFHATTTTTTMDRCHDSVASLETCIHQLTDTAFTTFTQFKIYIYQICSRVTAEMVLQKQHDMAHTLTQLASRVQHQQDDLQEYWESKWNKAVVLDEQRQVRHDTWLSEQDAIHQKQTTVMESMTSLAVRIQDGQGFLQQFWDKVWERTKEQQEEWEQQSAVWYQQQQSLQQDQIQAFDTFRREMMDLQRRHAYLVEQHAQQVEFLAHRHKSDLETMQERHDQQLEQRHATWLLQQQTVQQDQTNELERHRQDLQAWQQNQSYQVEQHAKQIQQLTERHYHELQQWQQQQAVQVRKHEEELQTFANGIAASTKPLLATETLVKNLFAGWTWWTSLLYFLVMLNLLWLLTLPRRCRSARAWLFAIAIGQVLLEYLIDSHDCSAMTTKSTTTTTTTTFWAWLQPSCRRVMEHRREAIGWLRQGAILLECLVYLIGFASSFLGTVSNANASSANNNMDIRLQEMESRHLELLKRLEQRSSFITELLLQPNDMLSLPPPPANTVFNLEHGGNQQQQHHATMYRRGRPSRSNIVSPQNQQQLPPPPSKQSSRDDDDDSTDLLPLPPILNMAGSDHKVSGRSCNEQQFLLNDATNTGEFVFDDDDDGGDNNNDGDAMFRSSPAYHHGLRNQVTCLPQQEAVVGPSTLVLLPSDQNDGVAAPRGSKRTHSETDLEEILSSSPPPPKKVARTT